MTWVAIVVASLGCLLLKVAGWSVPTRVLSGDRLRRTTVLVPAALLAALVVVQTLGAGHQLRVDARAAGLAVAAVALMLRAPFLLVVVSAAATAALLRAI